MPAYPSLFDGAPDRPKQEARDLVAYLDTLGRARELAGPEGDAHARQGCNCADDEMAQMAFHGDLNANPARARRNAPAPELAAVADPARGRDLFRHNCATCHGTRGRADGPGAASLIPHPANLSAHQFTVPHLSRALWNGVAGTAMPAWRDLPPADRAALAQAVREFYATSAEPALPHNILDLGARVYAANCAQCHGEHGAGDGPAAAELPIEPANFRTARPTFAESLRALRNGIEGTPMAPWTARLNEAELSAVAYYVRTFFQGQP